MSSSDRDINEASPKKNMKRYTQQLQGVSQLLKQSGSF